MKKTLFHISDDILKLQDLLETIEDEEQEQEILAYLDGVKEEFTEKVDNYLELIAELKARAEIRKQRAKEMAELAKADENLAEKLKATLLKHFQQHDISKLETPRHRVTVTKNGGKVPVILGEGWRPEDFPTEYQSVTIKPNAEAIRTALEKGESTLCNTGRSWSQFEDQVMDRHSRYNRICGLIILTEKLSKQ